MTAGRIVTSRSLKGLEEASSLVGTELILGEKRDENTSIGIPANLLLGSVSSSTIVEVRSISDLPAASGGFHALAANTAYLLFEPINLGSNGLDISAGNIAIWDMSLNKNPITIFSASVGIKGTSLSGVNYIKCTILVGSGVKLFEVDTPIANGTVAIILVDFFVFSIGVGWEIGNIDKISIIQDTPGVLQGYTTGLTFNDTFGSRFRALAFFGDTTSGFDNVTLNGIVSGGLTMKDCDFTLNASGNAFKINDNTTGDIILKDNEIATPTGSFFSSAANTINQTTRNILSDGNLSVANSAVFGKYVMTGNTTETVISNADEWTDIAGTATADANIERMIFANVDKSLTLDAIQPVKKIFDFKGSVQWQAATVEARIGIFVNAESTPRIERVIRPDPSGSVTSGFDISDTILVNDGDKVFPRIKNVDTTVNFIVDELIAITGSVI